MEIIRSILLGIVQGLTEFLPVSSSGHLEIVKFISNDQSLGEESMMMTVVLHFATALSTIVVFRKDIIEILSGLFKKFLSPEQKFSLLIILSMIPAVIVGLVFETQIESLFNKNMLLVGGALLVTGLLLFVADKAKNTTKSVGVKEAILIGIAQAVAILPGISRSGATISSSVLLGVDREKAARFSFLMVVPLIFGKMFKDILGGDFSFDSSQTLNLSIGFIAAFLTGLFACNLMIKLVKKAELKYFAYYCFVVGIGAIVYTLIKG